MIAWLTASCDPESYGRLKVFKFPKERTIYGPMQIESRIEQDTEISQKLTLWGQMESQVIRGNLMVIPIEDSLIYVEPVYLQAVQSKFPELKRVILAYGDQIVMEPNLDMANEKVFKLSKKSEIITSEPIDSGQPISVIGIEQVKKMYAEMKQALKKLDMTEFGTLFSKMGKILDKSGGK